MKKREITYREFDSKIHDLRFAFKNRLCFAPLIEIPLKKEEYLSHLNLSSKEPDKFYQECLYRELIIEKLISGSCYVGITEDCLGIIQDWLYVEGVGDAP